MLVIAVEALTQHLVGIAHDEKGGGVGLLYRPLQGHDLLLLEGHQQHLLVLSGPAALAVEKGDAPVHIVNNGVGNLVVGVADDIGHLALSMP